MSVSKIDLKADGQALAIVQGLPANGAKIETLEFSVALSSEWSGFVSYWLLIQKPGAEVLRVPIENGRAAAQVPEDMGIYDRLAVAIMAEGEGQRMSTQARVIYLNIEELRAKNG